MAARTAGERAEDQSDPQARQRMRELAEETALLVGQPTFETRRGTRRRHAELRAKLRELRALEQRFTAEI